jgi:hypothetical protein
VRVTDDRGAAGGVDAAIAMIAPTFMPPPLLTA